MDVWFVAVLLFICSLSEAYDVNKVCATALTNNAPHMSQYVGQTFDTYGEHSSTEGYYYTVGICVALNDAGCSVLQISKTDPKNKRCVGRTGSNQVARTDDGAWIELTYTDGDNYTSHCNNEDRKSRVVFLCDPFVSGKGDLDFLEENRSSDLCYYLFSIVGSGVCGLGYSWGDVVLIIVASSLGLWLLFMILGCLYKRCVLGARGWEQLPLMRFYQEFGNLQADGCDFVCRTTPRSPRGYKQANQFAADVSESEEEKDDNLLPM